MRAIEGFVGGSGVRLIHGLLCLVQSRFDAQPERDDLRVQGEPALVQIRLNGIRRMKICNGAGRDQAKPPLHILFRLSLRLRRSWSLRTRSILRIDHSDSQDQTYQALHYYFLSFFAASTMVFSVGISFSSGAVLLNVRM